MPWKSDAQRRWGNSPAGKAALGGQAKVDEWNEATKGAKLPDHVKKYPEMAKHKHVHRVTEK